MKKTMKNIVCVLVLILIITTMCLISCNYKKTRYYLFRDRIIEVFSEEQGCFFYFKNVEKIRIQVPKIEYSRYSSGDYYTFIVETNNENVHHILSEKIMATFETNEKPKLVIKNIQVVDEYEIY